MNSIDYRFSLKSIHDGVDGCHCFDSLTEIAAQNPASVDSPSFDRQMRSLSLVSPTELDACLYGIGNEINVWKDLIFHSKWKKVHFYLVVFGRKMIQLNPVSPIGGAYDQGMMHRYPGCTTNFSCFQCMKSVYLACWVYLCVVQCTKWCCPVCKTDHALTNRNLAALNSSCVCQYRRFESLVWTVNDVNHYFLVSKAVDGMHCYLVAIYC